MILIQKPVRAIKKKKMKAFILFFILCYSSCAQNITYRNLNELELEVVDAFLNQKYDSKDSFYFNKIITQLKFNNNFKGNYSRELRIFKISDSICKNSIDTLSLKLRCPMAFYKRKYVNLIAENDFKHFNEFYGQNFNESLMINVEFFLGKSLPLIKEHSINFYESYEIDKRKALIDFKETPSLEITGVYFSQNMELVIIAHSMIETYMGGGLQYSIMKKENGVWWRLIGSFQLSYV